MKGSRFVEFPVSFLVLAFLGDQIRSQVLSFLILITFYLILITFKEFLITLLLLYNKNLIYIKCLWHQFLSEWKNNNNNNNQSASNNKSFRDSRTGCLGLTWTDLGPEKNLSIDETAICPLHRMLWLVGQTSELVSSVMLDCSTTSVSTRL